MFISQLGYSSNSHSLQAKLKPETIKTSPTGLLALPLAAGLLTVCDLGIRASAIGLPTLPLLMRYTLVSVPEKPALALQLTEVSPCKPPEAVVGPCASGEEENAPTPLQQSQVSLYWAVLGQLCGWLS